MDWTLNPADVTVVVPTTGIWGKQILKLYCIAKIGLTTIGLDQDLISRSQLPITTIPYRIMCGDEAL